MTATDRSAQRLEHLAIALDVAVPMAQHHLLRLARVRGRERADELVLEWAREAADAVASKGDILQFRGARPGDTAGVFAQLSRGLAALSTAPGGVTFAGRHWEMALDDATAGC